MKNSVQLAGYIYEYRVLTACYRDTEGDRQSLELKRQMVELETQVLLTTPIVSSLESQLTGQLPANRSPRSGTEIRDMADVPPLKETRQSGDIIEDSHSSSSLTGKTAVTVEAGKSSEQPLPELHDTSLQTSTRSFQSGNSAVVRNSKILCACIIVHCFIA